MFFRRDTEAFSRFIRNYWRYYRELEKECLQIRRYVDFHEDDFDTYSVEFLKMQQALCSEIDTIGNVMASLIDSRHKPDNKNNSIYKWWYIIQDEYMVTEYYEEHAKQKADTVYVALKDYEVLFSLELRVKPWESFAVEQYIAKDGSCRHRLQNGATIPGWWNDYNKVKHSRTSRIDFSSHKLNYCKANFKNVCYAFSGLFILEKAFMQAVGTVDDLERFMDYSELFDEFTSMTSAETDMLFSI